MVNSNNDEVDQVLKEAEAMHLMAQIELRRQFKEDGASEAELDEGLPISQSEEQIVELKKIAEKMLSQRNRPKKS